MTRLAWRNNLLARLFNKGYYNKELNFTGIGKFKKCKDLIEKEYFMHDYNTSEQKAVVILI